MTRQRTGRSTEVGGESRKRGQGVWADLAEGQQWGEVGYLHGKLC